MAWKFVSPGKRGVPDRIILFPGGRLWFVELKAPGENPGPLQVKRHRQLERLGFRVRCLDSTESIKAFMGEVMRGEV